MKKILNYLQNHPYGTAIGIILTFAFGIIGIITWQFPKEQNTSTQTEDTKMLQGSIFDLPQKLSGKTTLENQELMKEYIGIKVKDKGYIIDIAKKSPYLLGGGEDYLAADIVATTTKKSSSNMIGIESSSYISPVVECRFSEDWFRTLKTLDISDEIEFSGEIVDDSNYPTAFIGYYVPSFRLENCSLIK